MDLRSSVGIEFPVSKLTDFRERWDELESSTNPMAQVVMAHLRALETKKNPNARFDHKLALIRNLFKSGFSREDIRELFAFIDWVSALPEYLEEKLVVGESSSDTMRWLYEIFVIRHILIDNPARLGFG